MLVSFSNVTPPQCGHFVPAGRIESDSGVNHASAPDFANSSTTLRLTALSFSGLPQLSHRKTAIGTPQTRCLEMHQSGRVAIMLESRSSPHAGSHLTCLISVRVRVRRVSSFDVPPGMGVSIEMNHCSVARKITGLWQRQQWGYECSNVAECISAPRDRSNSTMIGFALNTY